MATEPATESHFATMLVVANEFTTVNKFRDEVIYSISIRRGYAATPIDIHVNEVIFVDMAAEGLLSETTTKVVSHTPNMWTAHYSGVVVFRGVRIGVTACEGISQEAADAIIASAAQIA
jgi:hypothetical protein